MSDSNMVRPPLPPPPPNPRSHPTGLRVVFVVFLFFGFFPLSVSLSVCLSLCLSVSLSLHLFIYLCIYFIASSDIRLFPICFDIKNARNECKGSLGTNYVLLFCVVFTVQ